MTQIQLVICIRKAGYKVFRTYGPWCDTVQECFTPEVKRYILSHTKYLSVFYEFKTREIEEPKEEDAAKQSCLPLLYTHKQIIITTTDCNKIYILWRQDIEGS